MISSIKEKKDQGKTDRKALHEPLSWHHYADTSRWKITGERISLAGIPSDYDEIIWPEIRRR